PGLDLAEAVAAVAGQRVAVVTLLGRLIDDAVAAGWTRRHEVAVAGRVGDRARVGAVGSTAVQQVQVSPGPAARRRAPRASLHAAGAPRQVAFVAGDAGRHGDTEEERDQREVCKGYGSHAAEISAIE